MKELWNRDDELMKLLKDQGLMTTSPDFTGRVIKLVEEQARKPVQVYKPLLSRRIVFFIAVAITLLLAIYGWAIRPDQTGEMVYLDTIKPFLDGISNIGFSIQIPVESLLIATIVIACIGLLLSLDILFSRRFKAA